MPESNEAPAPEAPLTGSDPDSAVSIAEADETQGPRAPWLHRKGPFGLPLIWTILIAVVVAAMVVVGAILISNHVQKYNEERAEAISDHGSAQEAFQDGLSALDDAISAAETALEAVTSEQVADELVIPNLSAALGNAEELSEEMSSRGPVRIESASNEEIAADTKGLKADEDEIFGERGNLEAAIENLNLSVETKRIAVAKAGAQGIGYEDLFRAGESAAGNYYRFEGKIIQDAGSGTYRVNMTREQGYSLVFWEDTIMVSISGATSQRLLEEDIISFVAVSAGVTSYESIFGATIELPLVVADGGDVSVVGRD